MRPDLSLKAAHSINFTCNVRRGANDCCYNIALDSLVPWLKAKYTRTDRVMFLVSRSLLCVFLLLLPSLLCAAQIAYFRADVPVMSQSRADQQRAAKAGLQDVLVRVSGTEETRKNAVIKARVGRALSFVSEFQYTDVERQDWQEQGYKHVLRLSFSNRLVRKLLNEAQLPIWSVNRPKTLLWLVEDSVEHGKRMLAFEPDNELTIGIQQAAEYRGLPLIHPLLDFDDQLSLGAERLWQLDEPAILEASARYNADVVLVGKYSATSVGTVLSSWQYFHANRSRVYEKSSDSPATVGYEAILPLADFLASLYSYRSSDSESIWLSVTNVTNFADYRGLIDSLAAFDTITDVKVDRVSHHQIDLRLKSEASLEQIANQITLARKLIATQDSDVSQVPEWERAESGSRENPLLYQWQR